MKLPDDIKDFLPRYLTEESTQVLLQQIDEDVANFFNENFWDLI